ncbi:RNA-directed DNA polymerase [Leifsonia aquatica]|uniref:RNA-directed DNA polymerase n=1 Tax=Leifsonia aquatica TaxID=144185 RepID=UPI0028A9547A|nr:RNA-directed DNA polymerase [Leifsonia aquatica]
MALKPDDVIQALLAHNYFPRIARTADEFPPCFTSEDFTVDLSYALLDVERKLFSTVRTSATKFDLVPRRMEIPHPIAFGRIVSEIGNGWSQIRHITTNKSSVLRPRPHSDGRLISMEDASRRHRQAFSRRYAVTVDIANFFPSLYTHSIPWALMGRERAKANRSQSEFANRLDTVFRNAQRGETTGVPIGPGTSAIAAEIVLAHVDQRLSRCFDYVRFVDDFRYLARTNEEAVAFIRAVDASLRDLNLTINSRKTTITPLPVVARPSWIRRLAAAGPVTSRREALDLVDLAIELDIENPADSVIKYAMTQLESWVDADLAGDDKIARVDNELIDRLLALAYVRPIVIPHLCRMLIRTEVAITSSRKSALHELLMEHSLAGRPDVVAWLLFVVVRRAMKLRRETIDTLIEVEDSLVQSLLHHTNANRRVEERAKALASTLAHEIDADEHWLLWYTLAQRGVELPSTEWLDELEPLLAAGVQFVKPHPKSPGVRRSGGGGGGTSADG